jgi:hypothetical protein
MDQCRVFQIRICGIVVRFVCPTSIALPDNFLALRCEDTAAPHDIYTIHLLTKPLHPAEPMIASEGEARIYHTEKGWLHIYPALGDEEGCQVACLFCPDGHHTLYYPASRWAEYSEVLRCGHLICAERLLLRHDAILLHSSCVLCDGKMVLFSGPSGAGKSTQADLWHSHLDVPVINGDRTVIRLESGKFVASGSIWSGTSGVYRREQAPIAGIFLMDKAPYEAVERLGFGAFTPLFSQILVNSWDSAFMGKALDLLGALMEQVPVYRLSCRPIPKAVELGYETLFGKEILP